MVGMELQQIMRLECSICGQTIRTDRDTDKIVFALFGYKKFSRCPNCEQEVPKDLQTNEYKKKWIKKVKELLDSQQK